MDDQGIDFGAYDLGSLGDDVRSIVDVPGAIGQVAKYVFAIPLLVGIITWIVFTSRMATWVLVLFSLVAMVLSLVSAVVIGAYSVARKRLDTVAEASGRVVNVIGEMHADVIQIRDGHADTSVQEVAVGLLENAIFPAVFGTLNTAAETTLGPFGSLASKVTKAPMNLVQRSVIAAIGSLPDRKIGQMLDSASDAAPAVTDALAAVGDEYRRTRDNIQHIVQRVSRTALTSVIGLAIVATIPLLLWWLLGWVAS